MRMFSLVLVVALLSSPSRADGPAARVPSPPLLAPPLPMEPNAPPWTLEVVVRRVSTPSRAVWATGLGVFLVGWLAAGLGSTIGGATQLRGVGWVPIPGAAVAAFGAGDPGRTLFGIDTVVQAGGFVTFLVGLAAGPKKLAPVGWRIVPTSVVGGIGGAALALPF